MSPTAQPLTLYFDGACPLCSREARFFNLKAAPGRVQFVDIAAADFDAKSHGLDPHAVHREIHGRMPDGRIVVGVDALAQMWQLVPSTQWLATLTRKPVSRQAMQAGYWIFARLRRYLPGRSGPSGPGAACQMPGR